MVTSPSLLGNAAIALGLVEAGCAVATAYPGTPSTEILEELLRLKKSHRLDLYAEWSVNEKVAFDVALAAAISGKRAATAMKQVGLNVASDSLMSAAYTGVVGGFVVVSCDDPGPYSSQTEQDSRLFALFAKVPVLDPATPREARLLARHAMELSERHRVPVLLRPTIRVCHARQPVEIEPLVPTRRPAKFVRDPGRWAATPSFRLKLHQELNAKLEAIRAEFETFPGNEFSDGEGRRGIIACGIAHGIAVDVLREMGLQPPILKIVTPFPLPREAIRRMRERCDRILVLEEPDFAVEIQIAGVQGRRTGDVPTAGELTPETTAQVLARFFEIAEPERRPGPPPSRRPTLCPGCGHRAAFFAIRKALPNAIFPSDIGCYTLGINQKAVDTCVDMGASIGMAAGFYRAHRLDGEDVPIVATIGDSTFFHAGIPPLLNAHVTDARFILVILDNNIVAMTGFQPTPAAEGRADIRKIVEGIGIRFVEEIDAYDVPGMVVLVKRARAHTRSADGGIAVIVAKHPCALHEPSARKIPVEIAAEVCDGCDYCLKFCECSALVKIPATGKVEIDRAVCIDCGMCVHMCPLGAITETNVPVKT